MRCHVDGNPWCVWGMGNELRDGVHVFRAKGTKIGRIALPDRCANVCFGGSIGRRSSGSFCDLHAAPTRRFSLA
jgi:gluconolactonase